MAICLLTTVKKMKKAGVHVDPTFSLAETELAEKDTLQNRLRREMQVYNLQLLKKYKVPVTIACDSYNYTARTEMEYLSKLNVFSNLELVKSWCETTPLFIFPQRKIAALKEGYEASFLVLKENPLEHLPTVFNIQLRVKQGRVLW
jgi:imidazolonepropionase-like amidohydrolase